MMEDTDRVERLLALLLLGQMKGSTQREKIHQLNLAGFSNVEIANILGTTAGRSLPGTLRGQDRQNGKEGVLSFDR